ncbi:MAG: hypothetical protein KF746_09205 [Chitinophagaceae bacterium]|nr:hypothetical protein [Chitinophagaceae bacterium]
MKGFFLLLFAFLAHSTFLHAQVGEGEVEFNGIKRTVKRMEINNEPDIVEQSIKNRMAKSGYKPKESKGWLIFKDVDDREVSDERSDLYVKVERKSRKEKEVSVVYFFTSKPNDHATPVPLAGSMLTSDGFYEQVSAESVASKLEKDIAEQEEAAKKAEKKYDDLVKEQASLEKKIKGLQDDLESNKQKQQSQSREVENQRKMLEQLKSKRNS